MKKILLLGGSSQQLKAIKAARELGIYTILCDYLDDNPGQYIADKFYLVSTTEKEDILKVAQKENIDGILAYASDPAAPTAAYVAERLNLPGNPFESVDILCNKDKFRKFLLENGFNAPKGQGYSQVNEILNDKNFFDYPILIKPVDSSGSKGITVLQNSQGLENAVNFAFSFSRTHRVIVEQFIQKKHSYLIGGDIFIVNGKIKLWGLLNCHRNSVVNPLVPVGKSFPPKLEDIDLQNIKDVLSKMIEKLGIKNGSMNVEMIIDENDSVWPIDIGPRSGGNMIPELLGDIFEVDIAKLSIKLAMGEEANIDSCLSSGFYATHNIHSSQKGIYAGVEFNETLRKYIYRTCLYKKHGDAVEYFDNASKCLGIIFMKFPNEVEMDNVLNKIDMLIEVKIE